MALMIPKATSDISRGQPLNAEWWRFFKSVEVSLNAGGFAEQLDVIQKELAELSKPGIQPVKSVNGKYGAVILNAADVGADPVGTAAAAIADHAAAPDPHPQYTTVAEAAAAAPVQSVNGKVGSVALSATDVGADSAGSASVALAAAIEYASEGDAGKVDKPAVSSDAVFARGDDQWVNWLNGDFRLGTSSGLFGSGRELAVSAGTTGNNIAHLSFQGSRTVSGIFGTMNYYHQGNLVVSMGAARDGADDAGYYTISTKPTGGALANRLRILSDGSVLIGAAVASNGAGLMQVAGDVVPFTNNARALGSVSFRWSQTYSVQFRPGAGSAIWTSGTGTPEGVVTAPVGSLFTRTDGGAGTTLYVKESGAGNTGWVGK